MLIGFLSDQTYTNKKKIERNEEPNIILEKKNKIKSRVSTIELY